jgi:hypothetical protein
MLHAESNSSRKLISISYSGHVGAEEARSCVAEVSGLLRDQKPGFRLLTDLSGLESMDLDCVPHVEKMMDLCDQRGVQAVVRVIPDPHKDIGLNIMSLFHYHRHVHLTTCKTMTEAVKTLAEEKS